ncbi:hypothetical protein J2W49_001576 [Hydrogenophaga palleronii]|uniref:Uncharacterized protein n=1 Tax=Hydrogenophaga palleronii TaxID=65655 RepID=A0ABU1WK37_9BURK|nr:hypothetical protein [Hydrogenophaga palleronii]
MSSENRLITPDTLDREVPRLKTAPFTLRCTRRDSCESRLLGVGARGLW